ncbi:hypothetical protein BUALT_Bualt02G0180300 [Buddleja alternifolia]|uniref:CCHC-type domain-containing protein n=1 Tax=Buddleja alternifolia TaxID=168488 RepID=A0AAV6Y9T7_9LAMI|nr:hypothetical protein BUALT_Bualt02G0180300 [Buddleja alternifolia]
MFINSTSRALIQVQDCQEKLNTSLIDLKHLKFLDLSRNNFAGTQIPSFIGSLVSLEYLNLSSAGFQGIIPHHLGNLSNLRTQGLSKSLEVDSLQWLSDLSRLQNLDLNYVNLSKVADWLQVISKLPKLTELHLAYCSLDHIDSLSNPNFSSLVVLDLSNNQFQSLVPNWVFSLTNLVSLRLQENNFEGPIPSGQINMANLRYLDLSQNKLNSTLPYWLFNCKNLEFLFLSSNFFYGTISNAISNISSLRLLDLSTNEFSGKIPSELGNLCNLKKLDLSFNKFQGDLSEILGNNMSKCFLASLEILSFRANHLFGNLTEQLGELKNIQILDLGNFPTSFGQISNLEVLVIENNMLQGVVANLTKLSIISASGNPLTLQVNEDWTPPFQLGAIFLSSWNIGTRIPLWLQSQRSIYALDLSLTGVSGEVPTWIWNLVSSSVNLSHNQLFDNRLSGTIPWCLRNLTAMSSETKLANFSDSWDTLVVSVSNSAPNGDLTLQVVKDFLLNEESRRKKQAFSTDQNALVTENSDRRGRNKSRGPQHQRDKSRGKSKFKGDFKCHYCGGPNHYERDCRKKKRDQKNGNNENKKDDKDTTAVATDGDVVIICDDACVSSSCQETDWFIDSGASYHITPHRDIFISYTSGNFGRVRMANHGVTEVIGMGNINLETDTRCRLILRDVRHIPDIRLNIISTGKLDDDSYVNNFGEGKWKLTKGSLITAKGRKKNSLYLMQAKLSNGEVNAVVNNSSIELWHKRLGHLSRKGMQLLAKKKLLPDTLGPGEQKSYQKQRFVFLEEQTSDDTKQSERKESTQEVPDDLDPVPSRTTQDHGGDVQDEQNDITDDEPVDDQVPPIQTDDPVPPPEARVRSSIDLSHNQLSGLVPEELTSLAGLRSLNLSGNYFTGLIPNNIGDMVLLESLDVSRNQFSGEIPISITSLTFLNYLNLSFNNLSGRIPQSTQLQSFSSSSYIGNELCGVPLSNDCTVDVGEIPSTNNGGGSKHEIDGFYVCMALGFIVGVWMFAGSLIFKSHGEMHTFSC